MLIRDEKEIDRKAVHAVNTAAFERETEADLVDLLRGNTEPLVSLVAKNNGDIVGHILFSQVRLTGHPDVMIMGLGPMAVTPEFQRKGIGTELVKTGLEGCKQLGAGAVVVLGHPQYYPRFGFKTSSAFGIGCEYEVSEDAFMALELLPDYLQGKSGIIKYHEIFSSV